MLRVPVPEPITEDAEPVTGAAAGVASDTVGATAPTTGAKAFVAVDAVGADAPVTGPRAFTTADVAGAADVTGAATAGPTELAVVEEFDDDAPALVAGARAFVAVATTSPATPVPGAARVAAAEVEGFVWVEVAGEVAWLAD